MGRVSNVFVALLCCIMGFAGCTFDSKADSETISPWTIEDFYVYDENGELYNYPINETIRFYDNVDGLGCYYEENGGPDNLNCYTKRGVAAHSIAKMSFSEYDLSGFYGALTKWPVLGSLDGYENGLEDIFFEKYPDLNDAVKHTNEIGGDLALFLSAEFQIDEEGNVIQLELDEKGNPVEKDRSKDTYEIIFYIRKDNVFEWSVSHTPGRDIPVM